MLPVVHERVSATGIFGRAQLDENIELRAIARGFRLGDVDWPGVEILRVDLALGSTARISKT